MQVRPENAARHSIDDVEHVMVVVPVDAEVDEAEHIGGERRRERPQRRPVRAGRQAQLEHHDRDQDGDDAVAEGFEPRLMHEGDGFYRVPLSSKAFSWPGMYHAPRDAGEPKVGGYARRDFWPAMRYSTK